MWIRVCGWVIFPFQQMHRKKQIALYPIANCRSWKKCGSVIAGPPPCIYYALLVNICVTVLQCDDFFFSVSTKEVAKGHVGASRVECEITLITFSSHFSSGADHGRSVPSLVHWGWKSCGSAGLWSQPGVKCSCGPEHKRQMDERHSPVRCISFTLTILIIV